MAKILIIDDETQLRGLLSRIIGLEGYEVIQAENCTTGLRQLECTHPEVVLCDVKLPDGNGVEMVTPVSYTHLTEVIGDRTERECREERKCGDDHDYGESHHGEGHRVGLQRAGAFGNEFLVCQ